MNTRRRRKLGEERREQLGEKLVACDVLGSGFSSSRFNTCSQKKGYQPPHEPPLWSFCEVGMFGAQEALLLGCYWGRGREKRGAGSC